MTTDTTALDAGIAEADGPEKAREYADVKKWWDRIEEARKFDEPARTQYAKDRRYARGDSGFEVDANIIGTNIDILESFLYARDPDVDVTPAQACEPPSIDALRDVAEGMVESDPQVMQARLLAEQAALDMGADEMQAKAAGEQAALAVAETLIQTQFEELQKRYAKRQRDNKAYAQTIEILVSRLWKDAGLKARGRPWVRSGLTVGVGVLKASWQERTAPSPETTKAINDLQDNIKRAAAQRAALEDASGDELEAQIAEHERQLKALQGQAERVIARGFVVDVVRAEDFQVAVGFPIALHCDAPWNAHRIPMKCDEAAAHFGLGKEKMATAVKYTSRKPEMVRTTSAMVETNIKAEEADAFTQSGHGGEGGEWVMAWEVWDRESNTVLTLIEGVKCWAKPAWSPTATTRFYPFFLTTTSEVDGERHPQSLVTRSAKLADEYNRIGSAEKEHRSRIKPKTLFNAGSMPPEDVKKIEGGTTQELVGISPTNPKADLRGMVVPLAYAGLDPALYDRSRIIQELERIWGIQEALSGAISVEKTLGEAEIQQAGFQARTNGRRDIMEAALQELAQYTAEVARAHLSAEDVTGIAGPDALWPEYQGAADLASMVNVDIRAGSSGKPNTSAERQAWATQLPLLQQGIQMIGQLRMSTPADIADCYEKLLRITAERGGDRLDIDALIPKAGPAPLPGAPVPGAPAVPGEAAPADSAATPEPATA